MMRKLKNEELNRPSIDEYKKIKKIDVVIVLDNVRSLNNVGSIFRTSDAFLMKSIYLCGITAKPPHRDIHKTALGATESVNWKYVEKTIEAVHELKKDGYRLIAVEQTEQNVSLSDFVFRQEEKYAVVFGNEVKGVDQEIIDNCDDSIEIPQFGTKHSLNISVCAGIIIWELFKCLK